MMKKVGNILKNLWNFLTKWKTSSPKTQKNQREVNVGRVEAAFIIVSEGTKKTRHKIFEGRLLTFLEKDDYVETAKEEFKKFISNKYLVFDNEYYPLHTVQVIRVTEYDRKVLV